MHMHTNCVVRLVLILYPLAYRLSNRDEDVSDDDFDSDEWSDDEDDDAEPGSPLTQTVVRIICGKMWTNRINPGF